MVLHLISLSQEITRMIEDKFIKYLLTFTAIYFTIHVVIAIARGTI